MMPARAVKQRGIPWIVFSLLLASALAAGAPPPRLLVVVSVDQMRGEYLDRYASEYQGGFKALRERGAVLSDAHHGHVPTETGPGHAVILTGQWPERHGIVGNDWWDRLSSAPVYCVADSAHGLGPENLLAYTLGDGLKAKNPRSRVVSLSVKDRAAILMGGKKADVALWYDKNKGEFRSSSYYARLRWLDRFNAGLRKKGGVLAGASTSYYAQIIETPQADAMLLDLAREALRRERLGKDRDTDILAVSFSATDYVGHRYGIDGPRMREQLLALDQTLGELLSELDRRVGQDAYDLALTADHGVIPPPEDPSGRELGVRRVPVEEMGASFEKILQYNFPAPKPWVNAEQYPNLYLNRELARAMGIEWRVFLRQAAHFMRPVAGVAEIYIPEEIDPADPYAEAYRRSILPGRSGDLLVRVSSGVLAAWYPRGTDHGSPYPYDTHVPLVFFGPDFKPGRFPERALVADLAPTLAVLLGVELRPAPGARVRREVFREGR